MHLLRTDEPASGQHAFDGGAAQAARKLRVYVVAGGGPIFRRGLNAVLDAEPGLQWVGEAHDGAEAALKAPPASPDVVLVDADLSDIEGVTLVGGLRRTMPRTRFVVLADEPNAALEMRAIEAGASALLDKGVSTSELIAAVHEAHGATAVQPGVAWPTSLRREPQLGDDLTRRERDLLELMGQGLSNQQISARLDIALPTVKFHVTNILAKLNAGNRTEAVLVALRHRLVVLN